MRNRLSLFTVPYVVWMALLVVAPVIMVVIYAFTSNAGSFTLDNFSDMGAYVSIFSRSFQLAIVATLVCLLIGYPVAYAMAKEGPGFQRIAMVLIMLPMWVQLSAAHLFLDGYSGKQWPSQSVFQRHRPVRPGQRPLWHRYPVFPYDPHPGGGGAGHGLQLPALHDPAHLYGAAENGPLAGGSCSGPGGQHRVVCSEKLPSPCPCQGSSQG